MLDSGACVWFAKLVAIGETVVGLCLILGLFVGIAAFIGAFMNWNTTMPARPAATVSWRWEPFC